MIKKVAQVGSLSSFIILGIFFWAFLCFHSFHHKCPFNWKSSLFWGFPFVSTFFGRERLFTHSPLPISPFLSIAPSCIKYTLCNNNWETSPSKTTGHHIYITIFLPIIFIIIIRTTRRFNLPVDFICHAPTPYQARTHRRRRSR